MFTVQRIVKGTRCPIDLEEPALGDRDSDVFKEAMKLAQESIDMQNANVLMDTNLAGAREIIAMQEKMHSPEGVDEETAHDFCREFTAVDLEFHYDDSKPEQQPQQAVLLGSRQGTRSLDEAIGVLSYELEPRRSEENPEVYVQASRYEFFYPGDQVYVTNRYGKTVDSLR
ncbi:hypothetical protein BIZ78_gp267 [Erwinia phage vB_EamM_Caitlin]|uniref:hypothetical protein n=1 Tax=Erwinia phage vB_EamM_Caitlin TaxID=1883379 RepID=UPI00081CE3A8|nr:hypothetical protein BIZ78_gp267 [Erwinia phage vB_EamM_Caitlin]ANZ48308.1 hypothetical protein CAITLIN_13 [Erwinia phage vB_EamM_Caitlin]